jgi:outer membrane protein assembly factor BamB
MRALSSSPTRIEERNSDELDVSVVIKAASHHSDDYTLPMQRAISIVVVVLVLVGVAAVLRFSGGCETQRSRIAQRKIYDGRATLPANATEWPKWRGPFDDGISRETNLADKWPADGPPEFWSAEVGIGYASPVAAGGRVYVFSMSDSTETLTSFDANSGRIIWNQEGGRGRTSSYPGTRATPAIDGNDIITLGGAGELACRDVATGDPRWKVDILDATGATALDWGTASTPLVIGSLIYVQVGQGGPVAVAINRADGSIAWRSEVKGIAGYAGPVLADVVGESQLIVFGGKAVYGMDPQTGKTLWQHQATTSWDVNAATPIYRDGRLFLTSAYGSGAFMLELSADGPPRSIWQNQQAQSRFQPPTLDGDSVYLNSEGAFMCLNWADGKIRWKDDDNKLKLGLGGSFIRLSDDRIISLGERGRLSLARATPQEFSVISGASILDGAQIWAMPLIYGGRLYVKGEQDFVCYDISKAGPATTQVSNASNR